MLETPLFREEIGGWSGRLYYGGIVMMG